MATKQEVADYINANAETVLTAEDLSYFFYNLAS